MSRRHFGPQHNKNGYAEMGNALSRPRYSGGTSRSVAEAIQHARALAAREARAKSTKKAK